MDTYRVYYKGYVEVEAESEDEAMSMYDKDDFCIAEQEVTKIEKLED